MDGLRLFLCLLLFCALPAGAAEKPEATHAGFDGWWLRNGKAEVIAEPYPRLLAFRLKGGDSPLHVSHEYEYFGVRAWFLEPEQNRQSGLPALQPAVAKRTSSRSLRLGARALAVDYRILPQGLWFKVGTNTDAGWVAYVWDGLALKSSVPHAPDAEYPEDGGTITFFNSKKVTFEGKPRFGEIENLGPLTDLAPGDTLWLDQKLEIIGSVEGIDPEVWVDILGAD